MWIQRLGSRPSSAPSFYVVNFKTKNKKIKAPATSEHEPQKAKSQERSACQPSPMPRGPVAVGLGKMPHARLPRSRPCPQGIPRSDFSGFPARSYRSGLYGSWSGPRLQPHFCSFFAACIIGSHRMPFYITQPGLDPNCRVTRRVVSRGVGYPQTGLVSNRVC